MATPEEQREGLRRAIWIFSTWREGKTPEEICLVMLGLERYDQSRDPELWDELRRVMRTNPAFDDEYFKEDVCNPDDLAKGYWWHDPAMWGPEPGPGTGAGDETEG